VHRIIEDARHEAELVGAIVVRRSRKITAGVALRHAGNVLHATGERRGEKPRDEQRNRHRCGQRRQRRIPDRRELRAHIAQRQGHTHVADDRMPGSSRHIQHVGVDRRAVTPADADRIVGGRKYLGTRGVVLEGRELLLGLR
jgi:hypothetical protein